MAEIEVVEEKCVTLAELKDKLEKIKKEIELGFRSNKTLEYLNNFVKLKSNEAVELKNKLAQLEILRLKDKHIAKIIDFHPKDLDTLRIILSGENVTTKPEDLQKILDCLK